MRKKIQHSMILVITTTLLIAYAITTLVLYRHTMKIMETQIRQEAGYIYAAIEVSGESYMEVLDSVEKNTRITLINEQGIVEYDSAENGKTVLENHKDRPEVKAAMKTGSGQDIRQSNTVGKEMFYYAEKLPDGKILRVSKAMDTISRTALMILPSMGVIAVVMLLFAWLFAKWQVSRLIRPINELDLNEPLQNHEVYEELNPLLERIDQQNKEKDAIADMRKEFSANVSHELKTPLTSISGYAEIMKNGLVKPEDIPRFSDRIYQEARRLITLVEDIIKLSKLDEDKIELEREDVDLYQLTKEICTRLSPQLNAKNVHMSVIGEPVKIHGVRQVLDEMIYNICENAIKYNKNDGKVEVWVGDTLQGKKVIVTDTGIGIPEESQERIFERFYRVDKSHSKETGGTGLGLSIVKHGAILHNAEIHVQSKPGEGTRMEMVFIEKQ